MTRTAGVFYGLGLWLLLIWWVGFDVLYTVIGQCALMLLGLWLVVTIGTAIKNALRRQA
jgi:hypothetical protein